MYEYAIMWDWMAFAVRWAHVITGIAWIGSSFYFIALDLGLRRAANLPRGVAGEEWQVHGGGFYHIQKYMVAPKSMPEHLTWFKWEAYSTWLTGAALMFVVYYAGAELYLVDPEVLEISTLTAILLSVASIAGGWIIYDLLCRSPAGENSTLLMVLLFGVLVFMSWGYVQVFSGRAALLHLGAFTGTIMSANVFFIIIPNQKKVVADLIAGRDPDPALGLQAKQRSTHNNYLTLPVLFLMLSNHYPLAFATEFNWIIASLVFLMGVLIRHYFNTLHMRAGNPTWTWLLAAILFIIIMWLSTVPKALSELGTERAMTAHQQRFAQSALFGGVRDTVLSRCSMCHAQEPVWEGIHRAPKGVVLETDREIARYAREIFLQAGASRAMPPGNVSFIEAEERNLIVRWYNGVLSEGG